MDSNLRRAGRIPGIEDEMKTKLYALVPETVADRDGIAALKLAILENVPGDYSRLFAFGGEMLSEAGKNTIDYVKSKLEAVEVDEYGRDANGIDIAAALRTLECVKAV